MQIVKDMFYPLLLSWLVPSGKNQTKLKILVHTDM